MSDEKRSDFVACSVSQWSTCGWCCVGAVGAGRAAGHLHPSGGGSRPRPHSAHSPGESGHRGGDRGAREGSRQSPQDSRRPQASMFNKYKQAQTISSTVCSAHIQSMASSLI